MNTKLFMTASAVFLALVGIAAFFVPQEMLQYVGAPPAKASVVFVEMLGAVYLGLAMLNWMARGNAIGGIYSRPVALGNFTHFFAAAVTMLKQVLVTTHTVEFAVGALLYGGFAAGFSYLLFGAGRAPH